MQHDVHLCCCCRKRGKTCVTMFVPHVLSHTTLLSTYLEGYQLTRGICSAKALYMLAAFPRRCHLGGGSGLHRTLPHIHMGSTFKRIFEVQSRGHHTYSSLEGVCLALYPHTSCRSTTCSDCCQQRRKVPITLADPNPSQSQAWFRTSRSSEPIQVVCRLRTAHQLYGDFTGCCCADEADAARPLSAKANTFRVNGSSSTPCGSKAGAGGVAVGHHCNCSRWPGVLLPHHLAAAS